MDLLVRYVSGAALLLFVAYVPGLLLLRERPATLPVGFARILLSTIVTTLTGSALAALGYWSPAALILSNVAVAAAGLAVRPLARGDIDAALEPRRDRLGPLLFVAALAAYWPGWPVFLSGSDSSAYVGAGISLARHGTFSREDELGPTVPEEVKADLFDSMSQVFGSKGPPYRRMPGGILLESLDSTTAWPAFFPVPSVWSAIFVAAGATTEASADQAAPNYAPFFAALAVWAFWLLARSWLPPPFAVAATVLLAVSAPFYQSARLALSEPVACWFLVAGLASLAASRAPVARIDAILAGAALGAAAFTRLEMTLFLVLAAALRPSLAGALRRRADVRVPALPVATIVTFAVFLVLSALEAELVPGTWTWVFSDAIWNAWIDMNLRGRVPSFGVLAAAAAAGSAAFAFAVHRFGFSRTVRWAIVGGVVVGHAASANWLAPRTPMWLSFAIGWWGIALAGAGLFLAMRDRHPAASLVAAVGASAAIVLFWNPHVFPSLPWGWRRFTPMLLPCFVLLACHAASRVAASSSRVLGWLAVAALAWPIATAVRPMWRQELYAESFEMLEQVAAAVPPEGVLLIDRELSPAMVGPMLWLVKDRNSITVPATSSGDVASALIAPLVQKYAPQGPVWYLSGGMGKQSRTKGLRITPVARVFTSSRTMQGTYDERPAKVTKYLRPLALYRLEPSTDPLGDPVP